MCGLGALVVSGMGLALAALSFTSKSDDSEAAYGFVHSRAGDIARLSFDSLFLFRGPTPPDDGRIVYLDERSAVSLGQTFLAWDRRLHARLIRRLAEEGARAIFFDIVFLEDRNDPEGDEEFARAAREHGNVFLGAALELDDDKLHVRQERVVAPVPVLRRSAAGWGLIAFRPVDSDYGVRRIYGGMETIPSATWRTAVKLGAPLEDTVEAREQPRWVNYYGPADIFPNLSYDRVLDRDSVPEGFFRNKIVCVGGRSSLADRMVARDEFYIPASRLGGAHAKGAEVHLTILMNLLRGEWLTRMDARAELVLVACMGLMLGAGLPLFRPHIATILALATALAVFSVALWLFIAQRIWFAWGVPALVQMPIALGWAVGARYFVEERKRRVLRDAFAHYLSPVMVDRIAEAGLSIKPGGTVVEATTMFTDLDGFTPLAEKLENPERIAQVLTEYFTLTTRQILEADGTILKFVGDAVHAVWGTPLADAEHARKAVRAAWRLQQASLIEVDGRTLRTRIGVHTGRMVAGNLGSEQRFAFAVTGDAVNFASRLEGLNKYLGTTILISEETRRRVGEEFLIRRVGEFRVVGKTTSVIIHEVLGEAVSGAPASWVPVFERAVELFAEGNWEEAKRGFEEVIAARDGQDGPSAFYLQKMQVLPHEAGVRPSGIIELSAK